MKILLIRPPFAVEKFYFPKFVHESLALEYLESYLSKRHQVEIIDAVAEGFNKYRQLPAYPDLLFQGLNQSQILKKIKKFKPDVIGISWLFSTQNIAVDLTLKTIKKYNQNIPILVGGPHPSANKEEILKQKSDIDIIVYGEGELTTTELLDKNLKSLDTIKGIAYRNGNKIIVNQPRELIKNLDELPMPRRRRQQKNFSKQKLFRALYLKQKKIAIPKNINIAISSIISGLPLTDKIYNYLYNKRNKDSLPTADLITSRGCPNRCRFCAVHNLTGHLCRMRSADNVLKEIDYLVKVHGVKHINFQDDNFNVSKKRTINICKGIVKRKYNITILAPAGAFVPTLDEEVLTWLKRAGLNHLRMSIESGNQDILYNVIKKNIDLSTVKPIVDICKKLNIYTEGAFIFGIPGETKKTMQDSTDFAESVGFDRIIKFIFQPFPNTELYNECVKNDYLTDDYDPSQAYITGNKCFVETPYFSPEDVVSFVGR